MLSLGYLELSLVLFGVVLYFALTLFVNERRFQQFAVAQGCRLPPNASPKNYFAAIFQAWSRVGRMIRAEQTGEDLLDDIIGEDQKDGNSGGLTAHAIQFDGTQAIITSEPMNLQAILATQFKDYSIGALRIAQFYPILGTSIFSSDGPDWEHARAMFRPQFNREQINDLETTEAATQDLFEAFGDVDSNGWTGEVKTLPLLLNFTLDTASEFLFGQTIGAQRRRSHITQTSTTLSPRTSDQDAVADAASSQQFQDDLRHVNEVMLARIRIQRFYWAADGWQFRAAVRRIRNFTEQFIKRAQDPTSMEKQAGKKYNLLGALVKQTRDREDLCNQTLALLFAGRDTTAGLLAWSIARLSLHPSIFTTLRASILRDFGATSSIPITFTALKSSRYLQHFLNEVLRLHPIVPLNFRIANKHTTLPIGGGPEGRDPVAVRAGQLVLFSPYFLHRRQDLWGADAAEFRPERWGERTTPAWQYIPFSGGPRICLGQQFAITEASYLLVRICQMYDRIEPVDYEEMARLRKGIGLTMWPADEARVRFHRAE